MTQVDHRDGTPSGETFSEDIKNLGLRERKKLIRLRRIISVAHELFVDKGFTNTTIQDIAEAADVGLGTLYLYAKSKEDLLVLVFREHIVRMIEDSYAAVDPKDSLLDQILTFFEGHIEYHKKDKVLSRTVLKELSFSNTEQRKEDIDHVMGISYAKLMEVLERAQLDGKSDRPLYVGTAAWSAFALYYHLLQGFLCGFLTEEEFRKNLRNALSMLLGEFPG